MRLQRLQELRESKGLSQKEIAEVLKTTEEQYDRYEVGTDIIPVEKLDKLAVFYNTSIDYLVNRTDEIKPYATSIYYIPR